MNRDTGQDSRSARASSSLLEIGKAPSPTRSSLVTAGLIARRIGELCERLGRTDEAVAACIGAPAFISMGGPS